MSATYSSVTEFDFANVTSKDCAYDVAADDTLVVLVVAAKFYGKTPPFPYFDSLEVTGEDASSPYSDTAWVSADSYGLSKMEMYSEDYFGSSVEYPTGSGNRNFLVLGMYGKYYAAAAAGETVTISSAGGLAFEGAAHVIQITGVKRLQKLGGWGGTLQDDLVNGLVVTKGFIRSSGGTPEVGTSVSWFTYPDYSGTANAARNARIIRRSGQIRIAAAAYYDATLDIIGDPTGFTAIADTVSRADAAGLGLQTWRAAPAPDTLTTSLVPVPAVTVTSRMFVTQHWATFGADTTGSALLGHIA